MLLSLVAARCQSNPAPPPLENTAESSTPSPTASPAEVAPTLPAEAKGTSETAAKAFVRHYIELTNHAMATGDTEPLAAASDPACESCNAIINRITGVYAAGGSIESHGWRIGSIQAVPGEARRRPVFDLGIAMSSQRVKEDEKADPQAFDGGRLPATFTLKRQDGTWKVLQWERAA